MTECWTILDKKTLKNKLTSAQFWTGVEVWINKPHVVNRKLLASELLHTYVVPESAYNFHMTFADAFDMSIIEDFLFLEGIEDDDLNRSGISACAEYAPVTKIDKNDSQKTIIQIRKLIPRNLRCYKAALEAVIEDKEQNVVSFWPKEFAGASSPMTPPFPYRIRLDGNDVILERHRSYVKLWSKKEKFSEEWLRSCVLPKIIKWCYLPEDCIIPSLNLVSATSYCKNVNYLKEKYAKKYIEKWTENSDPLKSVHEDIGIAAYLLTIWEKEYIDLKLSAKQTFVDIGCGNGLLVDILTSEGYSGIGVDLRKRNIWDSYKKSTILIERCIEPSDYNTFPNFDWMIGNHCDELTPWIPVLAARSSYAMKVFLVPCCEFTFNGKYERCFGKSQYTSYLNFIKQLCENMGFLVAEDKLRIPSTRRTCFVCTARTYKEEDEKVIDAKRIDFIQSHSKPNVSEPCDPEEKPAENKSRNVVVAKESNWIKDFRPRNKIDEVRNCSQLDKNFLERLLLFVTNLLLKTENYILILRGSETVLWNAGGKMQIHELIKEIDQMTLKNLKNQCGGIQTFLKNHRNVFQTLNGNVQLNVPVKGSDLNTKYINKKSFGPKFYKFQEKPCFFYFNHPQGCPLEAPDCNFSHKID